MARTRLAETLLALEPDERRMQLRALSHRQRRALRTHWRMWAHEGQLPPAGAWHTWLILAGRGYGKTRAGAEWVRAMAEGDGGARIALVGASLGEGRRVMVEGPSGLLAVAPPRRRPAYEPSKRQLTWPNGAVATLYAAGEPESLRGPQHSHARGAWTWPDAIETPVNEQAESYLVGVGDTASPDLVWQPSEPRFPLTATQLVQLGVEHYGQPLWVRQIGSFAASDPLLLTAF